LRHSSPQPRPGLRSLARTALGASLAFALCASGSSAEAMFVGLGDLAAFPFVEPPDRRAVTDAVRPPQELGAPFRLRAPAGAAPPTL